MFTKVTAILIVVLVGAAMACADSALEDRVATLEARVDELQEQVEEPRVTAIVTRVAAASSTVCRYPDSTTLVEWVIAGVEESICAEPDGERATSARIGEPLPAACRD